MEKLHFKIFIEAPAEQVYDMMLSETSYTDWTEAFYPGSYFRGSWKAGEKILFLAKDPDGNEGGMVSKIIKAERGQIVSVEHYGVFDNGKEVTSGPEVNSWAGGLEEYSFETTSKGTLLKVAMDSNIENKSYFEETWPKALVKLKNICETK